MVFAVGLPFAHAMAAVQIENLSNIQPMNDFGLAPGKVELFLNPGETSSQAIYITDRIPGTTTFKVEVEDIKGSSDPTQPIVILQPGERGPYSGKDYIVPDVDEFTLQFGQRITIPVTVSIPETVQPGGYYSSVLVSNEPSVLGTTTPGSTAQSQTKIISRVGALYFIRVNGQANESGKLQDFSLDGPSKLFYESGPFTFDITFNNNGNVNLIPYGTITIKSTLGKEIAQLPVDAYFALPSSLRYRQISWDQGFLFGRYTATIQLNRGYGGLSDQKTIAFWVIPYRFVLAAIIAIFLLVTIIFVFLKKFEIRKK